ncbi:pro-FMRFamide-related neuropeptide FF isoform X1 [Equus przewalskii]|uniref:Pro-FMRFamide-related neuropeptide FF isoform X1 n=1 Tax=Equus przewalskii TaxID=9798 RepID=A0ABM2F444_EQUPR|nr:PREDICTED: pro-FMRFamide-related neuropeptide FF isoform X1 [Equus przewalskii]XP_008525723.1 PREDICTED: pro-FMRFamide-related neuropeptide FF isoform X1 [Equus przewalskii]XP_023499475.1 pro-FMRFamide-related neuropeptide FF isoform X1 [Equus caballus]
MDSRRAAVLLVVLLLITDWGHTEGPGGQNEGDQMFEGLHWVLTSEEMAPQPPTTCPWKPLPSPCDLNAQGLCPSSFPDASVAQEEDTEPYPPQDAQTPGPLRRSLLQAMQRPDWSPAFLFQPQRFGRNTWGSWSTKRLSPRAGEGLNSLFWSLAAPQRFGKKRHVLP